jgi:hypothetical protein
MRASASPGCARFARLNAMKGSFIAFSVMKDPFVALNVMKDPFITGRPGALVSLPP